MPDQEIMIELVMSVVMSCIDYCNSVLVAGAARTRSSSCCGCHERPRTRIAVC